MIELECAECVPDHMPLVTSHRASNGSVLVPHGDEVSLSCGAGRLLAYPTRAAVTARCDAGRYRVPGDAALRHLLELGCQEDVFEDVLHTVSCFHYPISHLNYKCDIWISVAQLYVSNYGFSRQTSSIDYLTL